MVGIMYPEADSIRKIIDEAQKIVIVQADNPDGDSLGSALALEQILGDMGKEPYLYCGVGVPSYLTYLAGWDRVSRDLPKQFDASIIVDTSSNELLENLDNSGQKQWLTSRPCVVIDHHVTPPTITFASVICSPKAVATGEVIYELVAQLKWPLSLPAKEALTAAIMSDSLGLITASTTSRSIHIIAELVEGGVSLPNLERRRRELMHKSPQLTHYKGELLQRVEYHADNKIATVTIPWQELEKYGHQYNPPMLVMEDMRMTTGTMIAIAFKTYSDGKSTAKIRCNPGVPIAADLAEHFGGGGHAYASGFKIQDGRRPFNEIKSECIEKALSLLDKLEKEPSDETIQHTYQTD
jgi:phosphoesterase RecJ-like protein